MASEPRDTSAASCAASGLLEIADLVPKAESALYRGRALRIIDSLTNRYAEWDDPDYEGILKEATGHLPAGQNINVSLIYGDYYYVESAAKLMGWKTGSSDPVFVVFIYSFRNPNIEAAAASKLISAFGPYVTAMSGDQLLDDGQPHSASAA